MALNQFLSPYGGGTNTNYTQAVAPIATAAVQQPGQFAGALSNNFGSYAGGLGAGMNAYGNAFGGYANGIGQLGNSASQMYGANASGLAGLGNSYANAYGAYGAGLGNVAGAMANERSNFYTANAQAEAARQMANANLGAAALGAYGGASSGALSAWAQDRTAYNKSLSDLAAANQMATSQYGSSRNNALGQLGNAYADTSKGLGGALALGNINFSMNGDMGGGGGANGFTATGPNGEIASGSYGDVGGMGMSATGSRTSNPDNVKDLVGPAYGGLGSLRDNLMSQDITGNLTGNYMTGLNALRQDHARGENMPSSLLGQSLSGIQSLASMGYGQNQSGMNQYYATQNNPANRSDYSGILGQLASGYGAAGRNIRSAQSALNQNYGSGLGVLRDLGGQLSSGYKDANANIGGAIDKLGSGYTAGNSALSDLWDKSLGNMELFQSPAEILRRNREAELLQRQYRQQDEEASKRNAGIARSSLLAEYGANNLKAWGLG